MPSAAWVKGAEGSHWSTQFTLCNSGLIDATVALKWPGHDADGRKGREYAYVVPAGQILTPEMGVWEVNYTGSWGGVLVTSTSPALFLQGETSSYLSGGSVGQALPGLRPKDDAAGVPKSLAPIRENNAYRTNLVLANLTEVPLSVHVVLHAADGTAVGARDVNLPPLGMTQINRVAAALGAPCIPAGRISVSTSTPGGLVAAYASVISNQTNEPRTLLRR